MEPLASHPFVTAEQAVYDGYRRVSFDRSTTSEWDFRSAVLQAAAVVDPMTTLLFAKAVVAWPREKLQEKAYGRLLIQVQKVWI